LTALNVQTARAHPADMYFQALTLHLTPQGVQVTWRVSPGVLLAQGMWIEADQDRDEQVSSTEARAWVEPRLPALAATVDGTTSLAWQLGAVQWPTSSEALQLGDESIQVALTAHWPAHLTGTHQLEIHNQFQERASTNWFFLHASDGVTFHPPAQYRGWLKVEWVFPPSPAAPLQDWESGTPDLPVMAKVLESVDGSLELPEMGEPGAPSILTALLRAPHLSAPFFLLALLVATVLGALHALTPGHGKAIVAAYLVGSGGTMWHAVALGAVVTLTHTGSVLVLGLVSLLASRYVLPTALFPILEMASGLLIVGLGVRLLYQYGRAWRTLAGRDRGRSAAPSYEINPSTGRTRITINQPIRERGLPHTHAQSSLPPPASQVSWRSLAALGVSGGLVPCPDAIAILLIALAINRIALGLGLIVAFSLGLALILIAVGLTIVQGKRLLQRLDSFDRLAVVAPFASAATVLVLGLGLTLNAATGAGLLGAPGGGDAVATNGSGAASSGQGRPFRVDQASVLYLAPDAHQRHQLAVMTLAAQEPITLTQEPLGAWEYALSPQKTTIAYTVLREDGGTDLWAINTDGTERRQLVGCGGFACGGAVWSPDGAKLVYEKRDLSDDSAVVFPTLWQLDPATGETSPLFQDEQLPGFNARWSTDGQWFSYVSPGSGKTRVYNLKDERSHTIANKLGSAAIWHPISETLLSVDLSGTSQEQTSHLMRFDLQSGQMEDLSANAAARDTSAAWSPDGQWIAVVRRVSGRSPLQGNQLWLMRPDGSEARALTTDLGFLHYAPAWSPEGTHLLYHRMALETAMVYPEIWLLEIASERRQLVIARGARPAWLP
jgi:ABC-type nickel/cobalt efflux system permease component RcnA/Tol biopolymer transport system component